MAPLRISVQVSCPNCQAGNLPGSPYCSRCGAPLSGVAAGTLGQGTFHAGNGAPDDPLRRFTAEGQDPAIVQQAYSRATEILTDGETLEYIAVASRGSLAHAPDCAVATSKRIILYRKKVLGKIEQDDCYWRDVSGAMMKEVRSDVTFTLDAIQGWQMAIESLPRRQAMRLYELAVAHSEKLAAALRLRAVPVENGLIGPEVGRASAATLDAIPFPQAPPGPGVQASPLAQVPSLPSVQSLPASVDNAPPQVLEPQPNPTPESVLQAILQQAARDNGAPTRPMTFSAAAFQAPVADAQPVTFSEPVMDTNTDLNMRSMPRLSSLEQIAVFSGPLTDSHLSRFDSAPLNRHTPIPKLPQNGSASNGAGGADVATGAQYVQPSDASHFHRDETEMRPQDAGEQVSAGAVDYQDELMPLPGSVAGGPLLEAAYDAGSANYPEDLISGSLETQQLYSQRSSELTDRITSTNLGTRYNGREQASGRTRKHTPHTRPGHASVAQKPKPSAGVPEGISTGRGEGGDPVQKMTQLKAMLDAGLIDSTDYEAKKAEILSRL